MTFLAPGVSIGGQYDLIEEIGRGGMGTVWRAHARRLDRQCAIKMLLPGLAEAAERQRGGLFREARILARLSSPYVVTVYDAGEWQGMPYVAMELLEGVTLRQLLKQTPVPPIEVTLEMMRQLALGLDKAHDAELIHRDLKPENIFLLDHKPLLAKILDFGIAKRAVPSETQTFETTTGSIRGTPLYMSPEQARGIREIDRRSDLWSLAVIAYECVVGKPPFGADTLFQLMLQIVSEPLPVPSHFKPHLPAAFDQWWAQAASRDPEQRPQSALALVQGLRDALERDAPPPAVAVAKPRAAVRRSGVALAAAGVAAVAGGLFYLQQLRAQRENAPVVHAEAVPTQPASRSAEPPPAAAQAQLTAAQAQLTAAQAQPAAAQAQPAAAQPPPTAAQAQPTTAQAQPAAAQLPPVAQARAAAQPPPAAAQTQPPPAAVASTPRRKPRASPAKLAKDQPPKRPEDDGDPLGF